MQNIKRDNEVMRVLDLKEISRVICNTDKSYLTLKLRKGETAYWLYLDSVPLSKEDNKEVMDILFPVKEKEIQQVNKLSTVEVSTQFPLGTGKPISITEVKKKAGRPAGSKNR